MQMDNPAAPVIRDAGCMAHVGWESAETLEANREDFRNGSPGMGSAVLSDKSFALEGSFPRLKPEERREKQTEICSTENTT